MAHQPLEIPPRVRTPASSGARTGELLEKGDRLLDPFEGLLPIDPPLLQIALDPLDKVLSQAWAE